VESSTFTRIAGLPASGGGNPLKSENGYWYDGSGSERFTFDPLSQPSPFIVYPSVEGGFDQIRPSYTTVPIA